MDQNELINQLFDQVHGLAPQERAASLRKLCPDEAVVQQVLKLFENLSAEPGFLEQPLSATFPNLLDSINIDGFRIIRKLGEGGMGIVYLAEETKLRRTVALKVLFPFHVASEEMKSRFRHEAEIAARLDHPAIVPVYRFSEGEGPQYLAMKYIDGVTFSDYCKSDAVSANPPDEPGGTPAHNRVRNICRILASIAHALHHAHSRGVVHRDVKPSNILIDPNGNAYLTDFGVAKISEQTVLTIADQTPGTPHYMSPEQAGNMLSRQPIDERTDVFSLGVVLYEALAGSRPFDGETVPQVLESIRSYYPPNLRSVNRRIPRDLATVASVAIEKDRRFRYPTAAHLATDLEQWLRGEPIFGRRLSIVQRTRRWVRCHRSAAAAIAAGIFLLIAGGLTAIVIQQQRATTSAVHVSASADAQLWIGATDPATLELSQPENRGRLPRSLRLRPGQYRLTARTADDAFAEASIVITRPGRTFDVVLTPLPALDGPVPGMVRFDGGTFLFGSPLKRGIGKERTVTVAPFYIDQAEVSNAEYDEFVTATQHPLPKHWSEHPQPSPNHYDPGLADRPIVGISWEDAEAYARWRGKRLPTMFEWEFAMRRPDDRLYPWGDADPAELPDAPCRDRFRAGYSDKEFLYQAYVKYTLPVRSAPSLATPTGLYHGDSNVQEMTDSVQVGQATLRCLKGAAWTQFTEDFSLRDGLELPFEDILNDGSIIGSTSMKVGFRCARSAQP